MGERAQRSCAASGFHVESLKFPQLKDPSRFHSRTFKRNVGLPPGSHPREAYLG